MALCNFHNTLLSSSSSSYSSSFSPLSPFLKPPNALRFFTKFSTSPFSLRALNSSNNDNPTGESAGGEAGPRRISEQSSWEAKDSEGRDYLYRLGKEADNMNIAVGARAGIIDDLFVGNFLGRDCNFLFRIGYFVGWKLGLWLSSKKWKYLSIGWVEFITIGNLKHCEMCHRGLNFPRFSQKANGHPLVAWKMGFYFVWEMT